MHGRPSPLPTATGTTAERALRDFVDRYERLFVLTGAGCSTPSGIPDYRDREGRWKRTPPVTFQAFTGNDLTRRRYWARGTIGWRRFRSVHPNDAHRALTRLEAGNRIELLLTQNVDRLHQAAGSEQVIDLHGRLDVVRCLGCGDETPRDAVQEALEALNPDWSVLDAADAPDGDADLDGVDFGAFTVPDCRRCGGMLKPDVVFFGESVPRPRVEAAFAALHRADAMLVVGSSLTVWSGFRFVQAAARAGTPIAAVNLGRTRADELLTLKVDAPCEDALRFLLTD